MLPVRHIFPRTHAVAEPFLFNGFRDQFFYILTVFDIYNIKAVQIPVRRIKVDRSEADQTLNQTPRDIDVEDPVKPYFIALYIKKAMLYKQSVLTQPVLRKSPGQPAPDPFSVMPDQILFFHSFASLAGFPLSYCLRLKKASKSGPKCDLLILQAQKQASGSLQKKYILL